MQITKRFLQYCLHRTRRWIFFTFWLRLPSSLRRGASSSLLPPCGREYYRFNCPLIVLFLTDLLQQFLLDQLELHAHGHLGDELLAAFLGHLFAVSQVNVTDASAALEIGQRLVCDPVTHCRGRRNKPCDLSLMIHTTLDSQ